MKFFNFFKKKINENPINNKTYLINKFPQINIHQTKVNEQDIITYKDFLEINLAYSIEKICNLKDDEEIKGINKIKFPFRDLNVTFSIEISNLDHKGEYTVWCPELRGCITQGKTKKEAFDNLLYAISEVLIINYDLLNHNPLSFPITPIPTNGEITFPNTISGYSSINSEFTWALIEVFELKHLYLGKKHIVFKSYNPKSTNITLLYEGVNDFTKFCIDNSIGS